WNAQPLGGYDLDLPVGMVAPEQLEAALYTLKTHGYQELFGLDLNPERMPPEEAVRASIEAIRAACDRINELDHESLVWAAEHPDQARGWVERYLVRARAPHPERFEPLPGWAGKGRPGWAPRPPWGATVSGRLAGRAGLCFSALR